MLTESSFGLLPRPLLRHGSRDKDRNRRQLGTGPPRTEIIDIKKWKVQSVQNGN